MEKQEYSFKTKRYILWLQVSCKNNYIALN